MSKILKKVQLSTGQCTQNSADPTKGTESNPYSQEEMLILLRDSTWNGGYVEGMGYVVPMMMGVGDSSGSGNENNIVKTAKKYKGIEEGKDNDNAIIIQWLKDVGVKEENIHVDKNGNVSPGWCAAFVAAVYREAGVTNKKYAMVTQWNSWGHSTTNPQQGDLGIIPDSHVGIFVRMEGDYAILISGNYSNKVMEHVVNRQFLVFRTQ